MLTKKGKVLRKSIAVYCFREYGWSPHIWDDRYKIRDLKQEQRIKRHNVEYNNFIEKALEQTGISKIKNRKSVSAIELGCGSGSLGAHLLEQGYSVDFSDYSSILTKRLQDEFGYNSFPADARNITLIKDNTYDVALLAGTVAQSDDYHNPLKFYSEINRILKPGGVFIHFLTTYLSVINSIVYSRLAQTIIWYLNPIKLLARNTLVRKQFGKGPGQKRISHWLYHPKEIKNMLLDNNFKMKDNHEFFMIEATLCRFFPFIKKRNDSIPHKKRNEFVPQLKYYSFDTIAFSKKESVLRQPTPFLSKLIRKYWPDLCAMSVGFIATKKPSNLPHE